jgi:hypothetical protein
MSERAIVSRPYPEHGHACERCVWARGEHAEWCELRPIVIGGRRFEVVPNCPEPILIFNPADFTHPRS